MSNENKRKTLANCKNSEFLPAAMKARRIVYEYYTKIDGKGISERYAEEIKDKETQVEKVLSFISDVIDEIFMQYPAETIEIAAIAGFMTIEEAETIEPAELYGILIECALSTRVLDFFINAARSVGRNTDSIFAALILLRLISGAATTSETKSQQNTKDTNASASVGDMSENA